MTPEAHTLLAIGLLESVRELPSASERRARAVAEAQAHALVAIAQVITGADTEHAIDPPLPKLGGTD